MRFFLRIVALHHGNATTIHLILLHLILSLHVLTDIVLGLSVSINLHWQLILLVLAVSVEVHLITLGVVGSRRGTPLILGALGEASSCVYGILILASILSLTSCNTSILRRLLAQMLRSHLVLLNLVRWKLHQIFEKPLVVLALVTDSSILFGITLGATKWTSIGVIDVFKLNICGQTALLGSVLVDRRLARVGLRLLRLLRRLGKAAVIYCSW